MMKKAGAAALVFVLGCQGAETGPVPEPRIELSRKLMGAVFGDELLTAGREPMRQTDLYLQVELDRLKTAGWQEGELALIRYGKAAIPPLIQLLDSKEESQAAIKPLGREVRTRSLTYTVGQVAYHVLMDIIGHRTNHRGELPPLDKKAWEDWWERTGSGLVFRTG